MTRLRLFLGFAATLGLTSGACAPEDPPARPSFARDVEPVLEAHCVRCHGAEGQLNGDKTSTNPTYQSAAETGYFNQYEDTMVDGMVTRAGAKGMAVAIKVYIHFGQMMRMPPDPAAPLSDWELKLIDNWAAAPNP